MKRPVSFIVVIAAVLQSGCSDDKPEPREAEAVASESAAKPPAAKPAPTGAAETGRVLFKKQGCFQCHSVDGTKGIGPTIKGQFGTQRKLVDGSTVVMDAAYIRATLDDPQRAVVAGYAPVMPPYKGKLTGPEIEAIVAYVESLR